LADWQSADWLIGNQLTANQLTDKKLIAHRGTRNVWLRIETK